MYRHMRKVHNLDVNRCVTLYCPIENCNQSYDRYNALDTHLTHVHYAEIRKEVFTFDDLAQFETWLRDITTSSKTKYIKRSCNSAYRYYRCHRSGLPKTSQDKINTMKSSVKIGRHCPSRIIAKITDRNVQVEFVPTHIGHECEIAKIPLSQKKRLDIACRLAATANSVATVAAVAVPNETPAEQQQQQQQHPHPQPLNPHHQTPLQIHDQHMQTPSQAPPPPQPPPQQANNTAGSNSSNNNNNANSNNNNIVNGISASSQATSSTIIQNDNSLMVTLPQMKPDQQQQHQHQQQQQQLALPMQQQTHIMQTELTQQQSQPQLANNQKLSLMPITPDRKQELRSKFEHLMSSIRYNKHASFVEAQLGVCLAFCQD